ncbi:MAG: FAD-dependent oxidoreductase [Planctomycetaceae bacterium]|nr:FAD-dependent oxidoreductase [Planctomycetaceae bacterium]
MDNAPSSPATEAIATQCCVVGGGPAGMMLGLLLARAGIDVVVLEKHADFLRDFRGDTIHPSTLEVLHELGILEEFLARPHQQIRSVRGNFEDFEVQVADLTTLSTHCKFMAMMPQWDFLDFLADEARKYPTFHLRMEARVERLVAEGGTIRGVVAQTPAGTLQVLAPLTVGADGRASIVRQQAGLAVEELGVPIDVLWMRLARSTDDPEQLIGRIRRGKILVMIDRRDYWQCAFVIRKGGLEEIQRQGLPAFRQQLVEIAPFLADRVAELSSWDQIKLLTVKVDRLRTWFRPGLLCIGDAAHAMSPVGGIGINLAIQDAVATANLLAAPLAEGRVTTADLERVQKRRLRPTRWTQSLQVFIQDRFLGRVIEDADATPTPPWPLRLFARWPWLRRIPARLVGMGFQPEHVQTPAAVNANPRA